MDRRHRDLLIVEYFQEGYPYELILSFLALLHGFSLSLRQLKRILQLLNLRRRLRPRQRLSRLTPRVLEALIRVSIYERCVPFTSSLVGINKDI